MTPNQIDKLEQLMKKGWNVAYRTDDNRVHDISRIGPPVHGEHERVAYFRHFGNYIALSNTNSYDILLYQPVCSFLDRKQLRWRFPTGQLVKPDEFFLFNTILYLHRTGKTNHITPRNVAAAHRIDAKRANYLFEKWAVRGWYEYGVSADLGWLTPTGLSVYPPE